MHQLSHNGRVVCISVVTVGLSWQIAAVNAGLACKVNEMSGFFLHAAKSKWHLLPNWIPLATYLCTCCRMQLTITSDLRVLQEFMLLTV